MAGIYVHIPFCRRACTYCDFHFSTNLSRKTELAEAIAQEAAMQADYFPTGQVLDTLYFGGGTPSLLHPSELEHIVEALHTHFRFAPDFEFTLECNPDDLDRERLQQFRDQGVNRLSIGVQSFVERDLSWMGRSHDARQALDSIALAREMGYDNLTVDLIYGIPHLSDAEWQANIQRLVDFGIPHVSAYALTVEPKTALAHAVAQEQVSIPEDDAYTRQYFYLIDALAAAGLQHYELSNFARPGWHSRHNSAYWAGEAYLGLGPSAHSYRPHTRHWNHAHNARYLRDLSTGQLPIAESEELSPTDQLNEYLLTQLRKTSGIERTEIQGRFGIDLWELEGPQLRGYIQQGLAQGDAQQFKLTRQGLLLSNAIIADLFQ